jgi:hypothetical protein
MLLTRCCDAETRGEQLKDFFIHNALAIALGSPYTHAEHGQPLKHGTHRGT